MDTKQINDSLSHLDCFVGTFPRDKLPLITRLPAGLVVNTDPSDKPGEHWVAIYLPKVGKPEYFDSYGLPPIHSDIVEFMDKNSVEGYYYSTITLQAFDSLTCGNYCILFILARCLNVPWPYVMSLFTNNRNFNDILAQIYTL